MIVITIGMLIIGDKTVKYALLKGIVAWIFILFIREVRKIIKPMMERRQR